MDNFHDLSDIQKFYKNSTVFLSGATGFVGKLVLEKILRALPIKKVYVLIREKKGISPTKRLQAVFESPIFDSIKRDKHYMLNNVFVMEGECSLPKLGLSEEDQMTFIEEVDVIFHVAASVKLNETIKNTSFTNVRSTRDLIILAHQALNLKAFVYVSTTFSNSPKIVIKEKIYPVNISAENLINICEVLDDKCLNIMTRTLIGKSPNSYTFGKQVTEDYINRCARSLPICIVRPAVVVSTLSEPVPAFIDNALGVAGFVLANSSGLNKVVHFRKDLILDIVPADIVVNACIAAGWQIGESFKSSKSEVPVYNISSVMENPISIDKALATCDHYMRQVPSEKLLITYALWFNITNRYIYIFCTMICIWISHIFDIILQLQGKKPTFARAIAKLNTFKDVHHYFVTNSAYPQINNTRRLLKTMSIKDRELFSFDVTTFNWEDYFSQYAKGLRVYVLKDPMQTLPDGLKRYIRLRNIFIGSILIVVSLLYLFVRYFCWSYLF